MTSLPTRARMKQSFPKLFHDPAEYVPAIEPVLFGLPNQMALSGGFEHSLGVWHFVNERDTDQMMIEAVNPTDIGDKRCRCERIVSVCLERNHSDFPVFPPAHITTEGGSPQSFSCGLNYHSVTFLTLLPVGNPQNGYLSGPIPTQMVNGCCHVN